MKEVLMGQFDKLYFALGVNLTPDQFSDIVQEALKTWERRDHGCIEIAWSMKIGLVDDVTPDMMLT